MPIDRAPPPLPVHSRALVLFARAPRPGSVKTRLARELGDAQATRIYRQLGRRVRDALGSLPRCALVVAFTPADGAPDVRRWLGDGWRYEAQCDGSLGERMAWAAERRLREGAERVLVVGTDCPEVDAAVAEAAYAALDQADVVFGPAHDGGYYLVALHARAFGGPVRPLFEEVPWSASDTLTCSVRRAEALGLRVRLLATLRDVDTADDWADWQRRSPAG